MNLVGAELKIRCVSARYQDLRSWQSGDWHEYVIDRQRVSLCDFNKKISLLGIENLTLITCYVSTAAKEIVVRE